MTMNLITGKAGAPHITSSDQGAMQAGLVGNGNYLLQGSDGKFPAVTMQSANKALVPVLNLVIEGRYARVTAAETVTIESGVTGRNRNDLICVKYTRDSNNIETIALAVLKGTATSGTAADPTVPSGSILNNSGTVWIPIARIPISGITAGTPVMLVKQLPPMSQLWDSVNQIHPVGSAVFLVSGQTPKSVGLPGTWVKTDWAIADKDRLVFDIENAQTSKNGANIRIYGWNDGAGQKFWFFTKQFGDVNMWIRTA